MIIALPFIPEVCNYAALAEKFIAAGACQNHSLYVISRERDTADADEFVQRVKPLFGRAEIVFLKTLPWSGQELRNEFFAKACQTAGKHQDLPGEYSASPLLYLDPKWEPCRDRWADLMQGEYISAGTRVVGIPERMPNLVVGKGPGAVTYDGAFRFDGPILLWRTIWRDSTMLNSLGPRESWRAAMRWELSASHKDRRDMLDGGQDALLCRTGVSRAPVPADDDDRNPLDDPPPKQAAAPQSPRRPVVPKPAPKQAAKPPAAEKDEDIF